MQQGVAQIVSNPVASDLYARGRVYYIVYYGQLLLVNPPLQNLRSYNTDVTGNDTADSTFMKDTRLWIYPAVGTRHCRVPTSGLLNKPIALDVAWVKNWCDRE